MVPLMLHTPIEDIYMVGPIMASRLHKLHIYTASDLLEHFPSRYDDYSIISKIAHLQEGEIVTVSAAVDEMKNIFTRSGKNVQQAKVSDDTGSIDVVWYNQSFLAKTILAGQKINLSGKVGRTSQYKLKLDSPIYEIVRGDGISIHTGRLVAIYPETYGVTSKWLRSRIAMLLRYLQETIEEFLPVSILSHNNLLPYGAALSEIHFPSTLEMAKRAYERLAFNELLLIQLSSLKRKSQWQKDTIGHTISVKKAQPHIEEFIHKLPFTLTGAQLRTIDEILTDLGKITPMNRLVEGEVGSGKTVVATIAMYVLFLQGFSSMLMAPTEILATQHFATIQKILKPFHIPVSLITGTTNRLKKKETGKKLTKKRGTPILYVGTHALLSKRVAVPKLGLVIIDEQQRFGVEQRAILKEKGINPHLLTMTATPIPRTVALTLYGELDLSIIDELPKERKIVKTWVVPSIKRDAAYEWIEKQVKTQHTQVFIICPFIEESESMTTIKAATVEYEKLKKTIFPRLSVGLLHGKMKVKERDQMLTAFQDKRLDILVATPIVEVGIDIPNAAIMMIEASDRFGLTQLHQLRGRVGRGKDQGYCLLFTQSENEQVIRRLRTLESIYVGSRLAELDLQMRGAGELYGTRQHGSAQLKIARLSDTHILTSSKNEAQALLPTIFTLPQSHPLSKALEKYTIKKVSND